MMPAMVNFQIRRRGNGLKKPIRTVDDQYLRTRIDHVTGCCLSAQEVNILVPVLDPHGAGLALIERPDGDSAHKSQKIGLLERVCLIAWNDLRNGAAE